MSRTTELLLVNFRSGWEVTVHHIQEDPNEVTAELQPLLVVAMKIDSPEVLLVKCSVPSHNPAAANAEQVTLVSLPYSTLLQSIHYFNLGHFSDKRIFWMLTCCPCRIGVES